MAPVNYARIELSAGGVIYRRAPAGIEVLLIKDAYGNWGFPKGHVEPGESNEGAALRETREETGLARLRLIGVLGTTDWYFRADGAVVHKYCDYFLMEADASEQAEPQAEEGIGACRWLQPNEALRRVTYENAKNVLVTALRSESLAVNQGGAPDEGHAGRARGK